MKRLICNKTFDKKQITSLIEWFIYNYGAIRTNSLINKIKFIGFKFSTKAGLSLGSEDLKIPSIKNQLIKDTTNLIGKKKKQYNSGKTTKQILLQKEIIIWNITNDTLKNEIIKNFRQTNLLNPVYMMIFSGARGNISQIKQLIGMRGLMSDSKGEIISLPIKSSLKEGLDSKEYFISCYGARKGIIDTALKTANSGYLTRKLVYAAQSVTIKQQDCKTKTGELIKLSSNKKYNYIAIKNKLIGTILLENLINKKGKKLACNGQDICPYLAKKIIQYESYILLRSILTCKIYAGICQLCYGWNLGNNKVVRIGEAVGILAAQSIGEPGTQLTMRTFHTGGVFTSKTNKVITAPHKGKLIYNNKNGKKIKSMFNENAFVLLREKKILIKKNKYLISQITLPESSMIFIRPKKRVFSKQIIAEITKQGSFKQSEKDTQETKCNNSGQTYFKNSKKNIKTLWVVNGHLLNHRTIYKCIVKNNIEDNRKSKIITPNIIQKKINKNPRKVSLVAINYKCTKKFKQNFKQEKAKAIYLLKKISNEKKKIMLIKNSTIVKFKKETKLTGTKNVVIESGIFLTKIKGQLTEIKKEKIRVMKSIPYLVPKESNIKIVENELIEKNTTIFKSQYEREKTKDIIEGLPKVEEILEAKKMQGSKRIKNNLHELLEKTFLIYKEKYNTKKSNKKTIKKIQQRLIKEIQGVYNSQGVNIAEKHISIIVKQVTSKVIITNKGDSNTIEGEIIDIQKIERINQTLKVKAIYEPILIGISKTSLLSEGFISSICFQETIRTLSKSAIKGEIDWLTGLKENIVLGNLIPAGTGITPMIE
uniref:DNA-directed RNA polymerase n=1 Tax=Lepocinclis playfairiana TaxID=1403386 RepID=A0A3G3LLE3_9EUGL|nr:RNA polymerase beta'' subunit [Lepocinclis playfairiana]AYQ93533.1 RNA polymerase beta'' subunit [Lepocinclis playfairiana]